MTITEIDEKFMREALAEARAAAAVGEVPIGAVVVRAGEIVARRIIAASSTRILRRMPIFGPVCRRSDAWTLAPFRLHGLRDARALLYVRGLMVTRAWGVARMARPMPRRARWVRCTTSMPIRA